MRYARNAETGECAGDGVEKGGDFGGVHGFGGVWCLPCMRELSSPLLPLIP